MEDVGRVGAVRLLTRVVPIIIGGKTLGEKTRRDFAVGGPKKDGETEKEKKGVSKRSRRTRDL